MDDAVAGLKMPETCTACGMSQARANMLAIYDELKK